MLLFFWVKKENYEKLKKLVKFKKILLLNYILMFGIIDCEL